MPLPTWTCPSCASDQTQRVAVIWSAGTSSVQTKTSGIAVGVGGEGLVPVVGKSSTSGIQQTRLAQQVGPPAKHPVASMIFMPLVAGPLLGLLLGFLLVGIFSLNDVGPVVMITYVLVQVGGVLAAVQGFRWNRDRWPVEYAAWDRRWFCHRCGTSFEGSAATAVAA